MRDGYDSGGANRASTSDRNITQSLENVNESNAHERIVDRLARAWRASSAELAFHPSTRRWRRLAFRDGANDVDRCVTLVLLGVKYYDDCESDAKALARERTEGGIDEAWMEARARFEADWFSRLWVTYRRNFAPLRGTKWTTDAGWGCTLRSAQMMLAHALSVHVRGRDWRREIETRRRDEDVGGDEDGDENVNGGGARTRRRGLGSFFDMFRRGGEISGTRRGSDAQEDILKWFADDERAPYGIHRVCETTARWNMPAGRWFEPSVMCRALEELISQHAAMRDQVVAHVVLAINEGDDAGGVPRVRRDELCAKSVDAGKALILFVPLVLGAGSTINTRYLDQLRAMLAFPQSIGILGGRPGRSLYVVGYSSDDVFFHLDPHTVQDCASGWHADTYYCSEISHTRGDALDPTLALGFYCRDASDVDDFLDAVARLARASHSAPILILHPSNVVIIGDDGDDDDDVSPQITTHSSPKFVDDEFADWEIL